MNRAYSLGANSFLVKPIDFQNYISISRLIHHYWLETSKLPETFRPGPGSEGAKSAANGSKSTPSLRPSLSANT